MTVRLPGSPGAGLLCLLGLILGCASEVAPVPAAAPDDRPDPAVLLEAVRAGDLDAVEETMRGVEERWGGGFERERALVNAWSAFYVSDPALTPAFDRWVEARPESFVSQLARAMHYSALGWRSRGARAFSESSAGQLAEMERLLAVAVAGVVRALELRPGLVAAHTVLIGSARASGNFGNCREASSRALADLGPASFQIRYSGMRCRLPRWGGLPRELEAFAEETEEYEDANPRLVALRGFPDAARGRRAADRGDHEKALEDYRRAARFGGYPALHLDRAGSLWLLGRFEEALVEANLGLRLAPDDRDLLVQKIRSLTRLGRADEVEALFERLAAIDPAGESLADRDGWLADAFDRQGYELLREQRYEAAVRSFDRVVDLRAPNATLLVNRGQARAMLRDVDGALADFEAAARLEPTRYEVYVGFDRVLAQRRDWEAIVKHWQRYLELVPNDGRAYLERAGTYHHWGRQPEERADLARACELGVERACQRLGR